jgi:hypothetical protein
VTLNNWGATLREACARRGIALDLAGSGAGAFVENPEEVLPQYDLVFAKARCALEAMACGAAVIVCDARGLAGMVTSAGVDALRGLNFGARTLQRSITVANVLGEIDRYDPADAARVSGRIRDIAGVDLLASQFIALYEELIAANVAVPADDELRAMAGSLEQMLPALYRRPGSGGATARLRRYLTNSRTMAAPARLLYRLKRLLT